MKTAIPCHWGTFGLLAQTPDAFVEAMEGASAKVLLPENGVAVTL